MAEPWYKRRLAAMQKFVDAGGGPVPTFSNMCGRRTVYLPCECKHCTKHAPVSVPR